MNKSRQKDKSSRDSDKNKKGFNEKSSTLTQYIPLISAIIAALGFVTVAIINRSATLIPIGYTQTSEARFTSVALVTQTYLSQVTHTPVVTPSPDDLLFTATVTVTIQPVLIFYVSADEAGVYAKSDQTTKPFQILPRGTPVEVLDASDFTWLYVTFIKDRTRITGFVLREQFTLEFVPMETSTPMP